MKSFCTTGLILVMSLSWTASQAAAQSVDYATPTLLPLPSASPLLSTPASYNSSPGNPLGMPLASNLAQTPTPAADADAPTPAKDGDDTDDMLGAPPCGTCGDSCNTCCGPRWFGSMGGLIMSRNRANPFWTTYQTNNNVNQLMNTQNAGAGWAGGGQVTVGYGLCGCGGPALAFTYWGVGPMNGFSEITDPTNNLSTPINLNTQSGSVMIGAQTAASFFDNSPDQKIWRSDRVNNFELNLLQSSFVNTGRLQITALAGFRYFRFDERLTYGSVAFGHNFGDNGGADEAYLGFGCSNNLFGAQLGAYFNYMLTNRLGLFFIPKAGIYGNQMNCRAQLYAGDGTQGFDISSHKSDISFLGELDGGLNWAINNSWRAYLGYRVVGVAGVALGDNQFLPYLADNAGFAQVKQNGDLILHGAMAGVTWVF